MQRTKTIIRQIVAQEKKHKNTQFLRSAFDTINDILANYKTDVK